MNLGKERRIAGERGEREGARRGQAMRGEVFGEEGRGRAKGEEESIEGRTATARRGKKGRKYEKGREGGGRVRRREARCAEGKGEMGWAGDRERGKGARGQVRREASARARGGGEERR